MRPQKFNKYFRYTLRSAQRNHGHTVLELLIALTIGLVLIAAVSGTFVWTSRNYTQDDSTARLQENARYALDAISRDIQMSGFLHDVINSAGIDNSLVAGTLSADCGASGVPWATVPDNLIQSLNQTSPLNIGSNYSCIDTSYIHLVGDSGSEFTDVLAIKRVKQPEGPLVDGKIYLQTAFDGTSRMIVHNLPGNPVGGAFTNAADWEYVANIYYVSTDNPDRYPTLYRKSLQGLNLGGSNDLRMDTEGGGIAEGVEYFHVTWGIDQEVVDGDAATLPDGQPNYFVSAPTAAEGPGVVAAKIYLLLRSKNHDVTYVDDKQYTLGDVTLPPTGTFNDNFKRKVFSTTIKIRNQVIRNAALSLIGV
jgi:type IV pilus assembly protein PilW